MINVGNFGAAGQSLPIKLILKCNKLVVKCNGTSHHRYSKFWSLAAAKAAATTAAVAAMAVVAAAAAAAAAAALATAQTLAQPARKKLFQIFRFCICAPMSFDVFLSFLKLLEG